MTGADEAAPTDCRVPDPSDKHAGADQFAGTAHRSGYTAERLAWIERWARKGATLHAGEGAVLCAEIDRLRALVAAGAAGGGASR